MKKIILLALCLSPTVLFAQSATDYFHTAANHYVNAQKKNAQTTVREGIRKFPTDQMLKNLASKIEELTDPEENQNQQNQQQQQNRNNEEQRNQQGSQPDKIKQSDAERMLNAIDNQEKNTLEKKKKIKVEQRGRAEKDW
jgi:hypothetical protein